LKTMTIPAGPRDEELMTLVAAGDSAAFEALYDRYAPAVLGTLVKTLQDRSLAEEVLQETFWRVWDKAQTFADDRGSFRAWVFSIARRQAIDTIRRQKVRPQAVRDSSEEMMLATRPNPGPDVDEAAWVAIESQRVRSAMERLSPEQVRVLELAYFEGLTRQEIARLTGEPLGTIHTRARLGLQKLRAILAGEREKQDDGAQESD
jgi:RNA polymerase sigma-70 factor (ECF subfamily)